MNVEIGGMAESCFLFRARSNIHEKDLFAMGGLFGIPKRKSGTFATVDEKSIFELEFSQESFRFVRNF
jgi:hypothetical protein